MTTGEYAVDHSAGVRGWLEDMADNTTDEFQGVTVWLGDGAPVTITDDMADVDLLEYIQSPGQRAVTVARLRRIADALDV